MDHREDVVSSDRSIAMRTSWPRVRTPVFSNNCCRLALTELSEAPMLLAISLLVSPSSTPRSTCCSRGVSALRRTARCPSDRFLVVPLAPAGHRSDRLQQRRGRAVL